MGPLAAGEDPHRLRLGLELVAVRAFALQPGQLRDVRLLDPALAVGAAPARAGAVGAALADLALAVDGDLPLRTDWLRILYQSSSQAVSLCSSDGNSYLPGLVPLFPSLTTLLIHMDAHPSMCIVFSMR